MASCRLDPPTRNLQRASAEDPIAFQRITTRAGWCRKWEKATDEQLKAHEPMAEQPIVEVPSKAATEPVALVTTEPATTLAGAETVQPAAITPAVPTSRSRPRTTSTEPAA